MILGFQLRKRLGRAWGETNRLKTHSFLQYILSLHPLSLSPGIQSLPCMVEIAVSPITVTPSVPTIQDCISFMATLETYRDGRFRGFLKRIQKIEEFLKTKKNDQIESRVDVLAQFTAKDHVSIIIQYLEMDEIDPCSDLPNPIPPPLINGRYFPPFWWR